MIDWKPINLNELNFEIDKGLSAMSNDQIKFWEKIKILPEKWSENEFGNEGDGFWVVAIFNDKIIWYNDIEDGFNIGEFDVIGKIKNYTAEQDDLNHAIMKIK